VRWDLWGEIVPDDPGFGGQVSQRGSALLLRLRAPRRSAADLWRVMCRLPVVPALLGVLAWGCNLFDFLEYPPDPTDPLEFSAWAEVVGDSLKYRLDVKNHSSDTISLHNDSHLEDCSLVSAAPRLYDLASDGGRRRWDGGRWTRSDPCIESVPTVTLAPGDESSFSGGLLIVEILWDTLPDGVYRIAVLPTYDEVPEHREVSVGEFELVHPTDPLEWDAWGKMLGDSMLQIGLRLHNPSSITVTLIDRLCAFGPYFPRVYDLSSAGGQLRWDGSLWNSPLPFCTGVASIPVVPDGDYRDSTRVLMRYIMGDSLPDGRYRIAVRTELEPLFADREISVGEFDLPRPAAAMTPAAGSSRR